MIYIRDLLNKIKWDPNEHPKDYTILYYDRIKKANKKLKFDYIKEIDSIFILVEVDDKKINLPIHRIREVRKDGKLIWKREP